MIIVKKCKLLKRMRFVSFFSFFLIEKVFTNNDEKGKIMVLSGIKWDKVGDSCVTDGRISSLFR